MSSNTPAAAAAQYDPEAAARIVRDIERIDADANLVITALSERMMGEVVRIATKALTEPWQIVEADWTARLICPDWKMTKGVGTGDAWLELTEIGGEDDEGLSWVSVAVGVGPTRFGLELTFRRGLQDYAADEVFDDKVVGPLLKLGMVRGDDTGRLYFPIDIPIAALSQAFATNDFDKALAPVGVVVKKALAAKAELDRLVNDVRAAAKK